MNIDQNLTANPRAAMPQAENLPMVMVEQEKFDAPLGRYIDRLGRNPFERDIITAHSRVKADLERLWPKTNDDGRQARRIWKIIDDTVQQIPQTTPQILVRVSSSRKPFAPSAPPVPKEQTILLTFDTTQYSLLHYDVPPDSEGAITPDMGIPAGLMVMCQRILPLQNAFKDTRPLATGPGASLFNVNEKDKPEDDARDLVLNPPDTSSPGMRPPNSLPVPPYLTRVDYPYGIYVKDPNGGHPILKTVAAAMVAEEFFKHETKILDKKNRKQQKALQQKAEAENRAAEKRHLAAIAGLTALSEEQKREEARSAMHRAENAQGGVAQPRNLGTLARQEVAAQAELLQTGGGTLNAGQPQRPAPSLDKAAEASMIIVPVVHVGTSDEPDGYQIDAMGIPITGNFDMTETMPIMPGGEGPANAILVNPERLNVAELNQDTDRVEGEPDDGPEITDSDNTYAQMELASDEIVTPENTQTNEQPNAPANTQGTAEPSVVEQGEAAQNRAPEQVQQEASPTINEANAEITEPVQTNAPATGPSESVSAQQEQPAAEPAHNEAQASENSSREQDSQQEDQSDPTKGNQQADEDRANANRGNENSGENQSQDNPRDEAHPDDQRADHQDSSQDNRQESQDSPHQEDGGDRSPDRGSDEGYNNQNPSDTSPNALEAIDFFHHTGLGHAHVMNGLHAGVHTALHAGLENGAANKGWITMPAHHVMDTMMGNSMLHTHKAMLAAAPHAGAVAHGATVTAAAQGSAVKGAVAAHASNLQGKARSISMPASGAGMLPFALNHKPNGTTGFVTSQRNQQWHDLRQREAMKYNYAPQGVAVHPAPHIPHEDLTPDM